MSHAIELGKVSFSYGGPLVLEDIDLDIEEGEFLGLVGPNASGKSTLLKVILGLHRPTAGQVRVFGRNPSEARHTIGYVPQFATFRRDFPISVNDMVLLGRLGATRVMGGYRADDRRKAERAMREAQVWDVRSRPIGTLSGGQLQRALVARALVSDPRLLILDEPTANIDVLAEEDIFQLFRQLNERMTIIVVSHDIGFISQYVQRVACLNRTLVCPQTGDITGEVIAQLY
ncbi:MAG: ABC transporter ATP-binding protein, partial [Gemmatimonadales bacterium]|nr:ABC transporter ATP-binding protein [Gemmatimonadales bacterium]